jgi:hypothetical protein
MAQHPPRDRAGARVRGLEQMHREMKGKLKKLVSRMGKAEKKEAEVRRGRACKALEGR